MINVRCHTNLDVRETWPSKLPGVPREGELIRSKYDLELEVCRVTWLYDGEVDVELHLVKCRFSCISDFEKWYNRRR